MAPLVQTGSVSAIRCELQSVDREGLETTSLFLVF